MVARVPDKRLVDRVERFHYTLKSGYQLKKVNYVKWTGSNV